MKRRSFMSLLGKALVVLPVIGSAKEQKDRQSCPVVDVADRTHYIIKGERYSCPPRITALEGIEPTQENWPPIEWVYDERKIKKWSNIEKMKADILRWPH